MPAVLDALNWMPFRVLQPSIRKGVMPKPDNLQKQKSKNAREKWKKSTACYTLPRKIEKPLVGTCIRFGFPGGFRFFHLFRIVHSVYGYFTWCSILPFGFRIPHSVSDSFIRFPIISSSACGIVQAGDWVVALFKGLGVLNWLLPPLRRARFLQANKKKGRWGGFLIRHFYSSRGSLKWANYCMYFRKSGQQVSLQHSSSNELKIKWRRPSTP